MSEEGVEKCLEMTKDIPFIQFHFTDLHGELRIMEERSEELRSILTNGLGVDGSSVPGYARVDSSDIVLVPEPETTKIFDICGQRTAQLWCHVSAPDGTPHPSDPRNILKREILALEALGIFPRMMSELEFILADKETNKPKDTAGYLSCPPDDHCFLYRRELAKRMTEAGIPARRLHHECAPGQNEVEYVLQPAMKNADDTLCGAWLAKCLADEEGMNALFSPKPLSDNAGNGLHEHIMLLDENEKNVMVGENGVGGGGEMPELCKKGRWFLGGLVGYSREIAAIFSHTSETFDRLRPGFEAPIAATWDYMNRNSLVRIPRVNRGVKGGQQLRVEFRAGDMSGSVHLLCAALLAAGRKGVEDEMECPKNVSEDVERMSAVDLTEKGISMLPSSIDECKQILSTSSFCQEFFHSSVLDHLLNVRK